MHSYFFSVCLSASILPLILSLDILYSLSVRPFFWTFLRLLALSFCHPVSSSVLLTAWPLPPWIDIMTFAIERLFRECTRWLGPSPIANDIPRCVQSSPVYKPSWSSETKLTGQPWRPAIQRFWNGPSATGQTRLKSLGELKNNCNHFLPAICR